VTKILGLSGKKQSGKNTAANFIVGHEMVSLGVVDSMRINHKGKLVVPALVGDEIKEGVLDLDNPKVQPWLREHVSPFVKLYSFADKLKEFCIDVLGFSFEQCYGTDDDKNTLTHLRWEDMPGVVTNEKLFDKVVKLLKNPVTQDEYFQPVYHEPGRMTAREVLQYFGTNVCRKMYGNVWADATVRHIAAENVPLAVVTDVRFPNEVEAIQNTQGKVIRFTRAPFAGDEHQSEKALDKEVFDWSKFDYVCDNATRDIAWQNGDVYSKLIEWGYLQ